MDFLSIGPVELLMVALVAFLFLGPARMIEMARSLGNIIRDIKRATSELPSLISPDEPMDQPPKIQSVETTETSESNAREESESER